MSNKSSNDYRPMKRFLDKFPDMSGNEVNGLGDSHSRRPSPFFWHKPELQQFGELQQTVTDYHRQSPAFREVFNPKADRGPAKSDRAEDRIQKTATEWTGLIKSFALENESDLVGITPTLEAWVYEGFEIKEPWIIMIGVAMDHDKLNQIPPSFENPVSAVEVGDKYNKAARASRKLTNYILAQGYEAKAFQGPYASALNMIPAALSAGFGELGKHGSIINRQYGSSFRLSAVTTDLPLIPDQEDCFGADEFCMRCQVCTRACPPDAIYDSKQMVRGVEKWYVDFDKCIPYFGEALGCGICIACCPWSTPGRAPGLAQKFTRRLKKSS